MTKKDEKLRPDCDQILKESHIWTLSLEELEGYPRIKLELEQILSQKTSDESIIEYFFKFYIQLLYGIYKKNKENEGKDEKATEREVTVNENEFLPNVESEANK